MSHGRVFMFVTDRKEVKTDDYYCPFEEHTMMQLIHGCDYVTLQDKSEFFDDLEWLSESYGIPVELEKIRKDDGKNVTVGIIDSKGVERIKEKLIIEKHKRIEKLKDELKKPEEKVDMWKISYDAYEASCFYFVSNDLAFSNEIGFLEDYLSYELPKEIIITESYDYHV